MSKFRIIYIVSLVILAALVITLVPPPAKNDEFGTMQEEPLLRTEDGWIIQFNVSNRSQENEEYIFNLQAGEKPLVTITVIPPGGIFTYIQRIRAGALAEDGKVTVGIQKNGQPVEQLVYYLKRGETE